MSEYDADVLIVGSGICGATAAYRLAQKGKSVIMLEAGERVPRWKIVENFRNSGRKYDLNNPYPNRPWAPTSYQEGYIENTGSFEFLPGMLKLAGGTTWHWAAATWRYLPNDMKLKTLYGKGRDWPMEYETLEPYYCQAEYELGVSGSDTQDQSGNRQSHSFPPRSQPYPVSPEPDIPVMQYLRKKLEPHDYTIVHEPNARTHVPYDGRPACRGNNNCMPVCPIGAMYSGAVHVDKAERAGAKLITGAVAYKIERGAGNKIAAIHYKTPQGEDKRLTARYFIIAAHSFETAKLLIMSDVANSSDQVGRNLMDHTGLNFHFLADEDVWMGRGPICGGSIMNMRDGDFRKRHSAINHVISNGNPQAALTRRLIEEGKMGSELDAAIRHYAGRWVELSTFFECLPSPANRVQPSSRKDSLGLPMLQVHYDVDDYIKAGSVVAHQQYQDIVRRCNGVFQDVSGWQNHDHLIGTMIMGADARDSVVNHEGRTFDHDNLFIASVGIIPAAGVVNPTLTGAALALRSADIIAAEA